MARARQGGASAVNISHSQPSLRTSCEVLGSEVLGPTSGVPSGVKMYFREGPKGVIKEY